ncbi:MAG: alpha/beta hydrolase [Gammaproteobacteria bacterium]|nr:alpha/beta hydrolase [Gammaproteobacteria bacterium]
MLVVRPAFGMLLLALLMSGCSPLRVISSVSPMGPGEAHRDIPFGAHGLTLDLYKPDTNTTDAALRPVIMFIHGGGWQSGTKEEYRFVASTLMRQGYVVVIPNYRLFPDVRFPEFVNDAADALRWTFDNIGQYGGDASNVFVMGHSAGGEIAALLHYDDSYLQVAGTQQRPCGFIGLSGPYDFLPLVGGPLEEIFPMATRASSQPINFVTGDEGPALLIHGYLDNTVKPRNSAKLAELVAAAGGQAQLIIVPKRQHASIVLALARPLSWLAPVAGDVNAFIRTHGCSAG